MKKNLLQKILLLSYVLFLSSLKIFSQTYIDTSTIQNSADILFDSLSTQLNTLTQDTNRVNLLNEISWNYAPTNYKKSITYADSAFNLAAKLNWEKGIAEALNNQGDALQYKGKLEEALLQHKKALQIFKRIKDLNGEAASLAKLGILYSSISNYVKSFSYFTLAGKIFQKIDDKFGEFKIYTSIGLLFYKIKDYNKSIHYFNKALTLSNNINDSFTLNHLYGNLALAYMDMGNYSNAVLYYKKAIKIDKAIKDIYSYSINVGNLGTVYSKQKKYNESLKYYLYALKYAKKINDRYGIAYQNGNIGEIKYYIATDTLSNLSLKEKENLLKESQNFLINAINEFSQMGLKEEEISYSYSLADVYKASSNFEKALVTFSSAKIQQDSIFSLELRKKIAEIEVNQRLKLQEKEIELLTKEKEYQGYVKKSLFAFAILLLVIIAAIFVLYSKIKKQNTSLKENIKDREAAEESLRKNQNELKKYQDHLESLVKERTLDLEKEIQERKLVEEDLLLAIERAESASKAKSVFLANMSHELRTPLVGILGYSDLLSKEVKDEESKEMAAGINRTGNKLLNTLSMVLDLARVESDKFEMNITKIDVIDLVKEIYHNFKAYADSKKLEFKLVLNEESIVIDADSGMLKVVLDNLVNNALKFTKTGYIEISSFIETENQKSYLIIKIKDTGIGIHKKDIPHIFNEFKQLSEGTVKEFPGTGLGLSITKKYIQLLNGEIIVESIYGEGSVFIIKIPTENNFIEA